MVRRVSSIARISAAIALLCSAPSHALYEDDVIISSDRDSISTNVSLRGFDEVRDFIEHGYPIQSVYLNGISRGFSIDDMVYMSVRVSPERAGQFVDAALDMLPSLPVWACRDESQRVEDRFAPLVPASSLGPVASLQEIARMYFEDNERVVPFPEWINNGAHVQVPVADLEPLLGDRNWYEVGRDDRPVNEPVMISLYRHDRSIVVDGNLDQVRRAIEQGDNFVPAVVLYNDGNQRPVSDFGAEPLVGDIVAAYLDGRTSVTFVPDWHEPYSDRHHTAAIDEFEEFTTLPTREEIEDARWDKITTELGADGFHRKPVMVSLYYNGARVWIDEPDRLTAARELGIDPVPVSYLYHNLDRLACGIIPGSDCEDKIRKAAELAGM